MAPTKQQRARKDVRLAAGRIARADADRDFYTRLVGSRVLADALTVAEAAELCGVSPRTIRRWRDAAATHGTGRKRR